MEKHYCDVCEKETKSGVVSICESFTLDNKPITLSVRLSDRNGAGDYCHDCVKRAVAILFGLKLPD